MPQYGVWLERVEGRSGVAISYDEGEDPPDPPEPQVTQFVWRGVAEDEEAALEAAHVAWKRRFGPNLRSQRCTVLEIEPGDSGYRQSADSD